MLPPALPCPALLPLDLHLLLAAEGGLAGAFLSCLVLGGMSHSRWNCMVLCLCKMNHLAPGGVLLIYYLTNEDLYN